MFEGVFVHYGYTLVLIVAFHHKHNSSVSFTFPPVLRIHSRAHQPLRVQESIDDIVSTSSIIMQVNTMSSIGLNDSCEVAVSNAREVHLDHRRNRFCNTTSGKAVASTVGKIGVCVLSALMYGREENCTDLQ